MDAHGNSFPDLKHNPTSVFHVEFNYNNLLVIPFRENQVVVCGNEHLGTLIKGSADDSLWGVHEDNFDGELLDRIGAAIDNYLTNKA
jgi:hypothetical protein